MVSGRRGGVMCENELVRWVTGRQAGDGDKIVSALASQMGQNRPLIIIVALPPHLQDTSELARSCNWAGRLAGREKGLPR